MGEVRRGRGRPVKIGGRVRFTDLLHSNARKATDDAKAPPLTRGGTCLCTIPTFWCTRGVHCLRQICTSEGAAGC